MTDPRRGYTPSVSKQDEFHKKFYLFLIFILMFGNSSFILLKLHMIAKSVQDLFFDKSMLLTAPFFFLFEGIDIIYET